MKIIDYERIIDYAYTYRDLTADERNSARDSDSLIKVMSKLIQEEIDKAIIRQLAIKTEIEKGCTEANANLDF